MFKDQDEEEYSSSFISNKLDERIENLRQKKQELQNQGVIRRDQASYSPAKNSNNNSAFRVTPNNKTGESIRK